MKPSIGLIVLYTLTLTDVSRIKDQRARSEGAKQGNGVNAGETYPLVITRVWPETTYADGTTVNGILLLDGNDGLWLTSVHHSEVAAEGTYFYQPGTPLIALVADERPAPSITSEQIAAILAASQVSIQTIFDKVTLASVRLPSGFVLTASSGAVSVENYDEGIGVEICMRQIEDQLWKLEGYALQKSLKPPTAREAELVALLTSARHIAERRGENTAWQRFSERLAQAGIGSITPKTFRVLPGEVPES